MTINKNWKLYKGKEVRLIVKDLPYPKPKDGIFIDIDETHVFLKIEGKEQPVPFSRHSIKRIDLKEEENG